MTTTFYAPPRAFRGDWVALPPDEARHATRVLRHRAGDEIVVVDGVGGWHRVALEEVGKAMAAGRVVETRREVGEPAYRLAIGLGLLKSASRFETFLEKAVELGVSEIVPLVTERTERMRLKAHRAENLLVAAMKQSGRSRLPLLRDPTPLGGQRGSDADLELLCHEAAAPEAALLAVLGDAPEAQRISVLIGPEGGFSEAEVDVARAAGAQVVSLGPRRLRAETAALTAAAAVMLSQAR